MYGIKQRNPQKHTIDVVFSLVLFCVFAIFAVTVLLIGIRAYRGITEQMNRTFDTQTVLSYIANKARQNDSQGSMDVADLEGVPALVLQLPIEGVDYVTYIYYHEGAVKEMFVEKGNPQAPEDGIVIAEGQGLEFSQKDGLIFVKYTSQSGEERSLCLSSRSDRRGGAA